MVFPSIFISGPKQLDLLHGCYDNEPIPLVWKGLIRSWEKKSSFCSTAESFELKHSQERYLPKGHSEITLLKSVLLFSSEYPRYIFIEVVIFIRETETHKETPPSPSFQLKYPTKQILGEDIKLFFTTPPLRRELETLFYKGCRNKSHIQKTQKGSSDKGFLQQKANLVTKMSSFHAIPTICSCRQSK